MSITGLVLEALLFCFIACLWIRFVVEWVQAFARSWTPSGPLLVILEVIYTLTDPPIMFVRRFVPPLRLGAVAIDVSFIIVMIFCYVLLALVRVVFIY